MTEEKNLSANQLSDEQLDGVVGGMDVQINDVVSTVSTAGGSDPLIKRVVSAAAGIPTKQ
jgi:hypothetical protein